MRVPSEQMEELRAIIKILQNSVNWYVVLQPPKLDRWKLELLEKPLLLTTQLNNWKMHKIFKSNNTFTSKLATLYPIYTAPRHMHPKPITHIQYCWQKDPSFCPKVTFRLLDPEGYPFNWKNICPSATTIHARSLNFYMKKVKLQGARQQSVLVWDRTKIDCLPCADSANDDHHTIVGGSRTLAWLVHISPNIIRQHAARHTYRTWGRGLS